MRKAWLVLAAAASVIGGLAFGYFVRRIERDVFRVGPRGPEPFDLEVEAVGDGAVTLRPLTKGAAKELTAAGWFGLLFEGGYARVGPLLSGGPATTGNVVRALEPVRGALQPGARARIDSFAFDGDPETAHGIAWEHVEICCVGCDGHGHPAWLVERSLDRWVIFVHGKGARREEALRAIPVVHEEGWSSLAITYRNDAECPTSPAGRYAFGAEEWQDVEAAVRFARDRGAQHIVIAGYSMGGGIALSFMRRSELSSLVRGLVLDAPMTDLASLLHARARRTRIPARVMGASLRLAGRRLGVDWTDLDYHRNGAHSGHRVLLFHGEGDDVIPVELSDRFAEARRESVRYHRIPDAGHVRSWNADRERYESALREWLRELL